MLLDRICSVSSSLISLVGSATVLIPPLPALYTLLWLLPAFGVYRFFSAIATTRSSQTTPKPIKHQSKKPTIKVGFLLIFF